MRVLVCGGRDYKDRQAIFDALDEIKPQMRLLIQGGAGGADHFARQWAEDRGVHYAQVPALWSVYGTKAGPFRNRVMLEQLMPNLVVAFPGGRGTAHMTQLAEAVGVKVIRAGLTVGERNGDV